MPKPFALTRVLFVVVAMLVLGAVSPAFAQDENSDDSPERITDRPKGESTGEKIARFPIRLALAPLWILDRTAEWLLFQVDHGKWIQRVSIQRQKLTDRGLFLQIGGAGDGAGFGGGLTWIPPGPRVQPMLGVSASIAGYQDHHAGVNWSPLFEDRVRLTTVGRYQSRPEEDFFGIGPNSREEDRTTYHLERTDVRLSASTSMAPFGIDGAVGYEKNNVFEGQDDRFPSTEELFTSTNTPGLDEGTEAVSAEIGLSVDLRDHPGAPSSGAALRVSGGLFQDVEDEDDFSFVTAAADLQVHVPLLGRGNRFGPRSVLTIRGRGEFTDPLDGGTVPFYALPSLGGSSTLRGYRESRFRDRHAILGSAEYRWRIQALLEAVLFFDTGQVRRDRAAFHAPDFDTSWGGGLRGVIADSMVFRFEVGTSDEGTRAFFKFSQLFEIGGGA